MGAERAEQQASPVPRAGTGGSQPWREPASPRRPHRALIRAAQRAPRGAEGWLPGNSRCAG